ncbi:MAG: hypothetical protein H6707_18160 [Deltaproteobacteria bacterium]|nr:hypothetical protein [Deltaproteobacteria bacterium]
MKTHTLRRLTIIAALLFAMPAMAQYGQPIPPPAPEGGAEPNPPIPPAPRAMAPGGRHGRVCGKCTPERVEPGLWGMTMRFGGLATMTATGSHIDGATGGRGLVIADVGLKYVLSETLQIPFWVGTGMRTADGNTDWGLRFGGGMEYHFRVRKRISPFIAAGLALGIDDPTGPANWTVAIGLAAQMGIEYFIANRLSLSGLYQFGFDFLIGDDAYPAVPGGFVFGFATTSGGALLITAYF